MRFSRYVLIKRLTILVSLLCVVNIVSIFVLSLFRRPKIVDIHAPQRIMIFAAHQDDAVIEAGGVAIKNSKLEGETTVVYLTIPPEPRYAKVRKREAREAWSMLKNVHLVFLDFESGYWDEKKVEMAEERIYSLIQKVKPKTVYIPLNEGGHFEHDLLSLMVSTVVKEYFPQVRVVPCAEYNPYYIAENTPAKVLWFIVRLMPFVPYKDPNYGLDPRNQMKLRMSKKELETKIEMLLRFKSQRKVIPISQFGYKDLFDFTNRDELKFLVKVFGKYLSLWTLLTLLLVFFSFFLWGVLFGIKISCLSRFLIGAYLVLSLFWLIVLYLTATNFKAILEDFLFLSSFSGGISFSLAAQTQRFRLSRSK